MIFFFKLIINSLFFSAKAKSFADKTTDIYDEPNNATIDKKYVRLNSELVDDAARYHLTVFKILKFGQNLAKVKSNELS
ncbi:hypothetical protein RhiirC2_790626 [Rhizophagus irregularis]|uniref:Uncharacterized protein n=1 Tax=Rhizophagus irregularis TaxID=588596 RepID=A0A2N1MKV2_9GLOM|nr:hypothetical protein RhiirC2_790626 [Rhizophagus irregularis]